MVSTEQVLAYGKLQPESFLEAHKVIIIQFQLINVVDGLTGMDAAVSEGGSNFSVRQKQLFSYGLLMLQSAW